MFQGVLPFLDPLEDSIQNTVVVIQREGVSLEIIMGDNALIAANITSQLDMDVKHIMTGSKIASLFREELKARVHEVEFLMEAGLGQKEVIVLALKDVGTVVGYTGDGINDVPTPHVTNAGISVESASGIAKNAVSTVLFEQDPGALLAGTREGRKIFANTLKYIFMTTSVNFGSIFSTAGIPPVLSLLPLPPK